MSVNGHVAGTSSDIFADTSRSLSLNSWRADAVARGRRLRFLMDVALLSQPQDFERQCASAALDTYLQSVRAAVANEKPVRRLRSAIFGARIDAAEINLNAGESVVARYFTDDEIDAQIPRLLAQVETCFAAGDPRRTEAIRGLAPSPSPPRTPSCDHRRRLFLQTLRSVNDIAQQQLIRVRSFRNKVGLWTGILLLVAITVGAIGALWPDAIQTCFRPTPPPDPAHPVACPAGQQMPTGGDVPLVLVLGVLGAVLSVAVALRSTRQTSSPYGVAGALLLMKLPCGALTALAGLLLIRGGFVPGFSAIDTQDQIVAYAVLFGFAQQLITRFADDKGREVIDKVQKSEPPPPAPAEARAIDLRDSAVGAQR